ncbi:MAG: hypothetical protein AAF380_00355 [Bacteroidota bacterium]
MIRIHFKQENASYPLFPSFLVYHGKAPWRYSTRLGDYYAHKILRLRYVSNFIDNTKHQFQSFINLSLESLEEQKQIMTSIVGALQQQ